MADARGVEKTVDKMNGHPPLVLFDADCGLCTTSARSLHGPVFRARVKTDAFQRVDLSALGLTVDKCGETLHVIDRAAGDAVFTGSDAVARVLRASRLPWPLVGWALALPGIRRLAGWVYGVVARNRHRLPGGSASCEMR